MADMGEQAPSGQAEDAIRRVAIVGGGTAGWIAAALLARALPHLAGGITVIESPDIGTIGVGEATIPPILDMLDFLGINQADFVRHTQSTYKLGIRFHDWRAVGESYWHPFGSFGVSINRRPFFHAWNKARAEGLDVKFNDFSLCAALGDENRFRFPDPAEPGPVSGLRYALHFDAGLVAQYLRAYAEHLGVRRLERTVATASQAADGRLEELVFTDSSRLGADLFIDCSGFRGVLIEQVLKTGYLDWSSVLPCDRAVALPTRQSGPRAPYTRSTARPAGWQWRIPLQHRVGNGYVYCSNQIGESEAHEDLLAQVGEAPLAEPRFLRFTTGRRRLFWNRNCVTLGLASGFLEPLESTSIHLVISGVYNLLDHFPDKRFAQSNIDHYNSQLIEEMEHIRDFIVLHYCATERSDSPLWAYCRAMTLPDSLAERIALYRDTGRIPVKAGELFTDLSWFYIFEGLGVRPRIHDPLMDVVGREKLGDILASLAHATAFSARRAPSHDSLFPAAAAPQMQAEGARP